MKKNKFKLYLQLLLSFMKIGVVTFGGGYAMIPIIENETSKNRKWISEEDLLEVVAISESTPGPIAICAASFIGYKVAGILGAFFATLGVVIPSLIIKAVISMFKKAPKHIIAYIIMAVSFLLVALFSTNVLVIILSSAVVGIVASFIARKRGHELK